MKKRKIDLAVISDVHLGTYGSHADELTIYLNSIQPDTLILNGDIIDIWHHNGHYFPAAHLKVIRKIINMAIRGTMVYYITGNHDQAIRRFSGTAMGNFCILDQLELEVDGKRVWFFHGDVFDLTTNNAKWITLLGNYGFKLLILMNRLINWTLSIQGKEKYSFSKRIREGSKKAGRYISDFERTAIDLAIQNGCDFVVLGHNHRPKKEQWQTKKGKCTYLNSGDWVENLSALEYSFKRWKIYRYNRDKLAPFFADEDLKDLDVHDLIASFNPKKEAKEKQGESLHDEGIL
tara:strand:- start:1753 stop:2625 length:873 start_codon:yes stop_codon:yes gene_type:complete